MILLIIYIFIFANSTNEQTNVRCYLNAQGVTAAFASKDDRFLLPSDLRLMVLRTEIEENGNGVEVVKPPTVRTYNLREKEGVCVDGFRIHHNPKNDAFYRYAARLFSVDSLNPMDVFVIDQHVYQETFKIDVPGLYNKLMMKFWVMSHKAGLKPLQKLTFPESKAMNSKETYCLMLNNINLWAMFPLGKLSESELNDIKNVKYLRFVFQIYKNGNIEEFINEYTAWFSKCSFPDRRKPIFVVKEISTNSRIIIHFSNSQKIEIFKLVLVPNCGGETLRILSPKTNALFKDSKLITVSEAKKRERKRYVHIGKRKLTYTYCENPNELNLELRVDRFDQFETNLGYTPEKSDLDKGIVYYKPPTQATNRKEDDSAKCYQE